MLSPHPTVRGATATALKELGMGGDKDSMEMLQAHDARHAPHTTPGLRVSIVRGLDSVRNELRGGVLSTWANLVAADASATQYQGHEWCLAWYEAYEAEYEALVLSLHDGNKLIALAPLCVERSNRHLHWAGLSFSDYRDVVAEPAHRERMLTELIAYYKGSAAPNVLRLGPLPPDSDSIALLETIVQAQPRLGIHRTHFGWRYLSELATPETSPTRNKATKYKLSFYKRNGGTIDVDVITNRQEWEQLRHVFYAQHSLRQLSAGRTISFDDPRKRRLFDLMFDNTAGHFTVLRASGRVIATHFGFRTGSLLHWGAPAFDIREAARSPSLLLLTLLTVDLKKFDLTGLDLTIGEGFLKENFSNVRVTLPSVDLYPNRFSFALANAQTRLTAALKTKPRLVQAAATTMSTAQRWQGSIQRHGIVGSAALLLRGLKHRVYERSTGLVLTMTPSQLQTQQSSATSNVRFGADAFEDLLLWSGTDAEAAYTLRTAAQSIIANSKAGRTLHTLVVDGRLACLGYSYLPDGPANLTETGNVQLDFEPDATSLYAFYTIPEFRGRKLYQQLLTEILRSRFQDGARIAYITVLENNVASRRAIEKLGFQRIQRNRIFRFFRYRREERTNLAATAA
jgi:CelD/BcsL family acetyltransferase involved in cellulose biosynthesis/ribosomal protein S18 acetylase RimI-like enzyme